MPSTWETIGIAVVSGVFGGVLVQGARVWFDTRMERSREQRRVLAQLHRALYPITLEAAGRARLDLTSWEDFGWRHTYAGLKQSVLDPWYQDWSLHVRRRRIHKAMSEAFRVTVVVQATRRLDDPARFKRELDLLIGALENLLDVVRKALRTTDIGLVKGSKPAAE